MSGCGFDVRNDKPGLINQICAWVSIHNMFGGRYINCEQMKIHLQGLPIPTLKMVVGLLYCEELRD